MTSITDNSTLEKMNDHQKSHPPRKKQIQKMSSVVKRSSKDSPKPSISGTAKLPPTQVDTDSDSNTDDGEIRTEGAEDQKIVYYYYYYIPVMHNTNEYISSQIHNAGGYGSEFESDTEQKKHRESFKDLIPKKRKGTDGVPKKKEMEDEYITEERKIHRFHILSMDAHARHKKFINDYLMYYGGRREDLQRDTSRDKTDFDVIQENHRFLWAEDDALDETWETKLAKKYYDKLFKEYCIADLSKYKDNKIGMRWRTEKEVVDGKGHFICGNKKCAIKDNLRSWEVNFGYLEHGEKKNALVKLRLCADCSYKLNYRNKRKEVLPKKKKQKKLKEVEDSEPEHKKQKSQENDLGDKTTASAKDTSSGSKSESQQESIWSGPAKIVEEKSRDEEFDDYFEDMFL